MEEARDRGEGGVVREPLKEFADVRDPEGAFEAGANLGEAFGKGQALLLLPRDRVAPAPSPAIKPSRSCTCWAVRPATQITLFRLASPAAIVMEERGTFKSFAKKSMQAALALPSTGGAVRDSFTASPTVPVMAFLFARG